MEAPCLRKVPARLAHVALARPDAGRYQPELPVGRLELQRSVDGVAGSFEIAVILPYESELEVR